MKKLLIFLTKYYSFCEIVDEIDYDSAWLQATCFQHVNSFGIILPRVLKPFYEQNIYESLQAAARYIKFGGNNNNLSKDICYVILTKSGAVYLSENLNEMLDINTSIESVLQKLTNSYGKINLGNSTHYYAVIEKDNYTTVTFTNNSWILEQEKSLLTIIFPTTIVTILITTALTYTWSSEVVYKIKKLKKKTESLNTNNYVVGKDFSIDDELNTLNRSIDTAYLSLKEKDEYKNYMFQNLSHELKTPISVIQSYVEASEDGVVEDKQALEVIDEEVRKLSSKVQTMLQFNKIDYLKDQKDLKDKKVNVVEIINESVERHKMQTKKVYWEIIVNSKKKDMQDDIKYIGIPDMWQMVVDNILGNFVRYAKSEIKIIINEDTITFFNDGEKIDNAIISNLFLPYTKGKKGQTGLGLSIVKRTVNLFGYNITATNYDNGVAFVIYK